MPIRERRVLPGEICLKELGKKIFSRTWVAWDMGHGHRTEDMGSSSVTNVRKHLSFQGIWELTGRRRRVVPGGGGSRSVEAPVTPA